jgi:hypothetical protein
MEILLLPGGVCHSKHLVLFTQKQFKGSLFSHS